MRIGTPRGEATLPFSFLPHFPKSETPLEKGKDGGGSEHAHSVHCKKSVDFTVKYLATSCQFLQASVSRTFLEIKKW